MRRKIWYSYNRKGTENCWLYNIYTYMYGFIYIHGFHYIYASLVAGGSVIKNPPASAGDVGSIPGSGRSPGEGNDIPLQYSCLDYPWTEEPGGLQSMESQKSRT